MTTKAADAPAPVSQGENCGFHPSQAGPLEHQHSRAANTVIKSGPLFISSRGIGWTSWKKRWFILTRTSLVFFRSDPTATPQRNGELNLTLGGIDLNNSG
ncbi:Rho GTPase-activating protein REN1-like protein, partial [Drosera capensis]